MVSRAVSRSWPIVPPRPTFIRESIGPDWLVRRLPDELARFFHRYTGAIVDSDEALALCGKLRHLRHMRQIDVSSYRVTDAGLEHLEGLTQLKLVVVANTRVTDAAVAKLKQALPNIRVLPHDLFQR
jgi:hypothetical protein